MRTINFQYSVGMNHRLTLDKSHLISLAPEWKFLIDSVYDCFVLSDYSAVLNSFNNILNENVVQQGVLQKPLVIIKRNLKNQSIACHLSPVVFGVLYVCLNRKPNKTPHWCRAKINDAIVREERAARKLARQTGPPIPPTTPLRISSMNCNFDFLISSRTILVIREKSKNILYCF